MIEGLEVLAARHGERELVRWTEDDSSTSYAELADLAGRWGTILRDAGAGPGDRVVVLASNGRAFLGAHYGAQRIGAISVPLNTELRGATLQHLLDLYAPSVVVAEPELEPVVRAVRTASSFVLLPTTTAVAGAEVVSERAASDADPCLIMSTSGTTGPSKGTVWTHGTVAQWATGYVRHLHYTESDRILCCTPLFHANSLVAGVATAMSFGGAVVISRRFSVSRFWGEVAASGATSANLLGSMIDLLLAHETESAAADRRRARLRTFLASSVTAAAYTAVQRSWGVTPVTAYGLTDFGTVLSTTEGVPAPPGTVGRPVDEFEIRLVDEHDREVERGAAGEAVLRTREPWIAPDTYFGMPEETLASRRNLWFHTGDLLRIDEDGWYFFAGRVKDSMRRRGENVSAFEVETAALRHEGVAEAAAYAVPADGSEDEIAIAVVAVLGASVLDPADLVVRIAAELPYFAVPRYVRVLEALPKTPTHKVRKAVLREEGLTADMWDREAAGIGVERNPGR